MKLKFIILVLILNSLTFFGQKYEPLELAQKLFLTDFPDVKKYSKDEFEGHPNKNDLGSNVKLDFKTLSQNVKTAVVNITVIDSLGKGFDTYLHFEKVKTWMITAYRALAQTGILQQMVHEFEKMSEKDKQDLFKIDELGIKSQKDLDNTIGNTKLTLESDGNIIKYFNDNKTRFADLKEKIEKFSKENPKLSNKEISKNFEKELKSLLIGNYGNFYFPCDSCFTLTIGGMIDNTVGYFYNTEKSEIPEMNPSRVIMIREIGNGWYIFKTT